MIYRANDNNKMKKKKKKRWKKKERKKIRMTIGMECIICIVKGRGENHWGIGGLGELSERREAE
jgi:hypothetical protein